MNKIGKVCLLVVAISLAVGGIAIVREDSRTKIAPVVAATKNVISSGDSAIRFVDVSDTEKVVNELKVSSVVKAPVRKLRLEKRNTLYLYEQITEDSMSKLIRQVKRMSDKLMPQEPIVLVLNTPGGDLEATLAFLKFAKSIPNKIITLSLKAASGGFLLAQGLDTRLITDRSIMWDHYGSVGGVSGTPFTSFEKNVANVRRNFGDRAKIIMARMKLSFKEYLDIMHDDLLLNGTEALVVRAADGVVDISCEEEMMDSTYDLSFILNLGFVNLPIKAKFDACPITWNPISIEINAPKKDSPSSKVEMTMELQKQISEKLKNEFIK